VDAQLPLVMALDDPGAMPGVVGGKGASLARLARAGFRWIDDQLAGLHGSAHDADALLASQEAARAAAWGRLARQDPRKAAAARKLVARWAVAAVPARPPRRRPGPDSIDGPPMSLGQHRWIVRRLWLLVRLCFEAFKIAFGL
jgi:hypothetical protein